jgi:hypothetical protein
MALVKLTLAVPVCWSARANAIMSSCLQSAMKTTRFGTDGVSNPLLFMVNEAEAAATYALVSAKAGLDVSFCVVPCDLQWANKSFQRQETFILLDCGGGTTDAGTYKISFEHPLRLSEEVTHPRGMQP